jgi:hypothetical protein
MPDRFSSEYWHARAEEARAIAGQMKDENTRNTMLGIARSYDHLARRAEERERPDQTPP